MIEIVDSEYAKAHSKRYDDKSIHDTNYTESTSSSCIYTENKVLVIMRIVGQATGLLVSKFTGQRAWLILISQFLCILSFLISVVKLLLASPLFVS